MSMHPSMMHSISKCGRQIGVTDVISKLSFSQSLSESQQRDGYIVRFIIQRTIGVEIKLLGGGLSYCSISSHFSVICD